MKYLSLNDPNTASQNFNLAKIYLSNHKNNTKY